MLQRRKYLHITVLYSSIYNHIFSFSFLYCDLHCYKVMHSFCKRCLYSQENRKNRLTHQCLLGKESCIWKLCQKNKKYQNIIKYFLMYITTLSKLQGLQWLLCTYTKLFTQFNISYLTSQAALEDWTPYMIYETRKGRSPACKLTGPILKNLMLWLQLKCRECITLSSVRQLPCVTFPCWKGLQW